MIKLLQINLNHCRIAQDLCLKYINTNNITIACISEPYKIKENHQWIGIPIGKAAIYWNTKEHKKNIKVVSKKENYAIVIIEEIILISVYISPNKNIREAEETIDDITKEIIKMGKSKKVIICGDLNAHSRTWGSKRETARRELINEWMAEMDLMVINKAEKVRV